MGQSETPQVVEVLEFARLLGGSGGVAWYGLVRLGADRWRSGGSGGSRGSGGSGGLRSKSTKWLIRCLVFVDFCEVDIQLNHETSR